MLCSPGDLKTIRTDMHQSIRRTSSLFPQRKRQWSRFPPAAGSGPGQQPNNTNCIRTAEPSAKDEAETRWDTNPEAGERGISFPYPSSCPLPQQEVRRRQLPFAIIFPAHSPAMSSVLGRSSHPDYAESLTCFFLKASCKMPFPPSACLKPLSKLPSPCAPIAAPAIKKMAVYRALLPRLFLLSWRMIAIF